MKNLGWKYIVEFIGIAAIVGSLIFVGRQMQQTQDIASNEDNYNRMTHEIEQKNAIFENADIWLRGNSGESLDRIESMIYIELLRTKWNRAYWQSATERRLGRIGDFPMHDFAWFLYQNPGARTAWEADAEERNMQRSLLTGREPGPVAVQDVVRADLIKLDQLKP
jgi:hypothetical protein